MEPMALGSASSSPTSAPGFLPPYLMGRHEGSTPKQILSSSPLVNRNPTYNLSTTEDGFASPIMKQRLFGPAFDSPPATEASVNVSKPGPPRQGLFDSIDVTRPTSPSAVTNNSTVFNTSYSYPLNTSQISKNDNTNNWVTVFGFGCESLTSILSIFATCGTIVDKRIPSQGNWINIKFSTKNEALRALSLNGKIIGNSVMIGVVPFIDKHNDKENFENSRTIYSSPMRVRSLKHSFVSPEGSDSVVPLQNVPQKSNGIVTKAMEYVFGW